MKTNLVELTELYPDRYKRSGRLTKVLVPEGTKGVGYSENALRDFVPIPDVKSPYYLLLYFIEVEGDWNGGDQEQFFDSVLITPREGEEFATYQDVVDTAKGWMENV